MSTRVNVQETTQIIMNSQSILDFYDTQNLKLVILTWPEEKITGTLVNSMESAPHIDHQSKQ